MSTRHLLPCGCGANNAIDTGQAGQIINCRACNKPLEVPTLRGIRRLEPEEEKPEQEKPHRREWTRSQGILFAVGSGLALTMLIASAILFFWKESIDTEQPPVPDITTVEQEEDFDDYIDSRSPDQLYDFWHENVETVEFKEWKPQEYVENRREVMLIEGIMKITVVLAGCGVLIAVISFVVKPKPRRPVRRG